MVWFRTGSYSLAVYFWGFRVSNFDGSTLLDSTITSLENAGMSIATPRFPFDYRFWSEML